MSMHGLCAPNTVVTDFAYGEEHPLRLGNYPVSKHSSMTSESDFYDDPSYESYSSDEINSRAVALFDFTPENDNEVPLKEGQEIWVSYRHGQGWLVAEDPQTGENGLVPEEYVEILSVASAEELDDEPQRFMPRMFQGFVGGPMGTQGQLKETGVRDFEGKDGGLNEDDEWEDIDDESGDAETLESVSNTLHSLESKFKSLDVK